FISNEKITVSNSRIYSQSSFISYKSIELKDRLELKPFSENDSITFGNTILFNIKEGRFCQNDSYLLKPLEYDLEEEEEEEEEPLPPLEEEASIWDIFFNVSNPQNEFEAQAEPISTDIIVNNEHLMHFKPYLIPNPVNN